MNQNIIQDNKTQFWLLVCVCFAAFVSSLDSYIVNISLPNISHYFDVSTGDVARVSLVYLLILTSTLMFIGKLGDTIGLKKIFVAGFIIFTIGSFFCGISPTFDLLLVSRCIQALGGSVLYAIGFAIVTNYMPADKRGRVFGVLGTVAALGFALGAPIGGILTGYLSWHWIFLVNIIPGILAIIISLKFIPPDRVVKTMKGFDFIGAVFIFISLSSFIYALNIGHEVGWTSITVVGSLLLSFIFFVLFIFREINVSEPLLDINLFKIKAFTFGNIANFTAILLFSGSNFLLPFYLILIQKLEVQQAGLIMIIYSLFYMVVSPIAGRLSDKIGSKQLCSIGLVSCIACSYYFIKFLGEDSLLPVVIFLVWFGISLGLFISPNNNLVLSFISDSKSGIASSVFKTITNLALVLGVCFFETIFSGTVPTKYAGVDQASLLKAGMPEELIIQGFQNAYVLGAVLCGVGLLFNVFINEKKKPSLSIDLEILEIEKAG